MAFLAPAIPALVTAGATAGANALFGPKGNPTAGLGSFAPPQIRAGGLTSGGPRVIDIKASPERLGLVDSIASMFPEQANLIAGQRARVAPGISDLRAARLAEVENARRESMGNLRDNLARRRVLGSSFGQDAITRSEAEFAGQKERVAAESFLQEFEMTNQLINQEFDLRRSEFSTHLDELNLEANLAAGLAKGATETMGANARTMAALQAKELEGAGKFFGQTWQPFFNQVGTSVGKIFA